MQFSVSGREERRGLLTPEAVAAADLSEGKSIEWGWAMGGWDGQEGSCELACSLDRSLLSVLFLALAVMGLESVMSYTDVPPGGELRFLMRNLMVFVMLSD